MSSSLAGYILATSGEDTFAEYTLGSFVATVGALPSRYHDNAVWVVHPVFWALTMLRLTTAVAFEAWRQARLPLVPFAKLSASIIGQEPCGLRARPKIGRIACPWLIRRFVNPGAVFLFVAPTDVRRGRALWGVPFDIEHVFWSHRGDTCTFDTMVEEFGLGTEPLLRLATIVRGADTRGRSFRQRLPVCLPRH
jgi:ChrB, C-terminal domain